MRGVRLLKKGDGPIIGKGSESAGAPPDPPADALSILYRHIYTILASDTVSIDLDKCFDKKH